MNKKVKAAITELLKYSPQSWQELEQRKRQIAKKWQINLPTNAQIISFYKQLVKNKKLSANPNLEHLLRKRAIRTLSGIAPVAVLTKPYPCPGKCVFCPTEKDVPQSYLSNEPAVMRAIRCNYHPFKQVVQRLRALEANGHRPQKIELIVIGGTWSYLPTHYQFWYIANCFAAANNYHLIKKGKKVSSIRSGLSLAKLKNALAKEQKKNEHSPYRIIGLTLETRPDFITAQELEQMRLLGCTRVELGAQTVDDQILELTRRGHSSQTVAAATALLKDFGFKVTYHLMPGLPGSTLAKDKQTFKKIFSCADFQPDQIKFYPTVVVKGSRLYQWWRQGKYQPYSTNQLKRLIAECKAMVPPFVRIVRLIRDIPSESIEAGNLVTNLRQILQQEKVNCRCIRCREIREQQSRAVPKLKILSYSASGGQEFFLSFEDYQNRLYAFCRLRLPSDKLPVPSPLKNAALVRELHVYGELVPVGGKAKVQHRGLGTKLMQKAEETAKKFGFKKIAVIAGVGARPYYRRLGYRLQYTYMVKRI